MSILEAIVLGAVQGLTEYLPISSTAHLRVLPAFAGWEDPGAAFTAVTQLGTMVAVLAYFREDLTRIARAWFASLVEPARRSELDARMGWYIVVATIPISVFGVIFEEQVETGARDLYLLSGAMIVGGLLLLLADRTGRRDRGVESIRTRDGIAVGMAQALALIPGASRSGVTITAGLFLGLERPAAARFSFLLAVPAIVLSGLFELRGLAGEGEGAGFVPLAVATVLAFAAGYATIGFLLRFLVTHTTFVFVAYRVVLGVVVIALAGAGAIR